MSNYEPGQRVRVTQQIPRETGTAITSAEGVVVRAGQQKTGSWFTHSRDGRFWLDRLELRADDGELIVCNLDQHSQVEVVDGAESD